MLRITMRTTLDLDDDILQAAKELAQSRGMTAGRVISDLVRQALRGPLVAGPTRNGVPLLAPRSSGEARVTMKRVHESQE